MAVVAGVVNVFEFKEPNTDPPQQVSLSTPQYAGHSEAPVADGVNRIVAVRQLLLQDDVPATQALLELTAPEPAPTTATLRPEPFTVTQKVLVLPEVESVT